MESALHINESQKPKKSFFRKLLKFLFWLIFIFILLITTSIALVFIYEDDVKAVIIKELNKNLNAEVRINPEDIDLTIIKTFPDCALEFKNITCMEAVKRKNKDTLLFAKELQLKFDVENLWNGKYNIEKIAIHDAFCRMKLDKKGNPNYLIWKSDSSGAKTNDSLTFKLEKIEIENTRWSFKKPKEELVISLHIDEFEFTGAFSETNYTLNGKGNLNVNNFIVNSKSYFKNKYVYLNSDLVINNNLYTLNNCEVKLNQMQLEATGKMEYADSLKNLNLNFKGKNLDIQSMLSLLPENYKSKINDYNSTGKIYAEGKMLYNKSWSTEIDFGIVNTQVVYVPENATLNNLNCKGKIISNTKNSVLQLTNISASLMNDQFTGNFILNDFNNPSISLDAAGDINLENVIKFWPIDTLSVLKGNVNFTTKVSGRVEEFKRNVLSDNAQLILNAGFKNLMIGFKGQTDTTKITTCDLNAQNKIIEVKNLQINKGKSDALINGKLEGLWNYITDKTQVLKIYGNLNSKLLVAEDFILADNSKTSEKREIDIADNLHFTLDASIKKFTFGKFVAQNISGGLELKNKKILAESVEMETMDGKASLDALFDFTGNNLNVASVSHLTNINVNKLFTQFNNFGQSTLQDKNIAGVLTASIDFSGSWSKFLEPDLNSIKTVANIIINNGTLNEFKPLESLSKFVDVNDLKNIKFSTLQSQIEIKKSLIIIPKTAIKNSALNIDLWGSHSFNNDIDYHIQLLISELLAKKRKGKADDEFGPVENDPDNRRSAFVLMTGTVDKPIIKYDKQGLKQKIKEDIKQEKQNLKQLLKEEFGLFKKDSIQVKEKNKAEQNFKLETESKKEKKKEEEEDDDF